MRLPLRLGAPLLLRGGTLALALGVALAAAVATGCAAEPPPKAAPPKHAATPAPKPVVIAAAIPGHARRAAVELALQSGPTWLLRRVMQEPAIGKDQHFLGWRLTGLPEEWSDIDLRPGDVVSRVNNHPIETQDEAFDAWKSIARAREIRLRVERDGLSREVVVPIDGEPSAELVRAIESDSPPPRPSASGRPRTVTSLGTDTPPGEDPNGWESY